MTSPPGSRPARQVSLLAQCAPGLGRMLRRELTDTDGVTVTGTGFDGESDVVFFLADRDGRGAAARSRLADGVFAELGRATRAGRGGAGSNWTPGPAGVTGVRRPASGRSGASAVAGGIWQAEAVQRALSVWAADVRPLSAAMTFRVTARVQADSRFSAPGLRHALAAAIGESRPRWRFAADAQLVIWAGEWHDGQYAGGIWLGDGRSAASLAGASPEALGQSLAGALVHLAGPPPRPRHGGDSGVLLDPCCGAGAILAEAAEAGWTVAGMDVAASAVQATAALLPGANVQLGDARDLLVPDDSVRACASWLPSRAADGDWGEWSAAALAELSRVTRTGGSVVLLAPELPRASIPAALRLRRQVPVRLADGAASIWVFRRA